VDTLTLILFVVGLGLLIVGAELLVRGASGLASRVGISPLVIGLTVMAFGTTHHVTTPPGERRLYQEPLCQRQGLG
jgi:hypothetical protein